MHRRYQHPLYYYKKPHTVKLKYIFPQYIVPRIRNHCRAYSANFSHRGILFHNINNDVFHTNMKVTSAPLVLSFFKNLGLSTRKWNYKSNHMPHTIVTTHIMLSNINRTHVCNDNYWKHLPPKKNFYILAWCFNSFLKFV